MRRLALVSAVCGLGILGVSACPPPKPSPPDGAHGALDVLPDGARPSDRGHLENTQPDTLLLAESGAHAPDMSMTVTPSWCTTFGGAPKTCASSDSWAGGLATDLDRNVYLTGSLFREESYRGYTYCAADIFVASYGSDGKPGWANHYTSYGLNRAGAGVAVDGNANLYHTGDFQGGGINFGGGLLLGTGGSSILEGLSTVFLASSTYAGQHRWSQSFKGYPPSYYDGRGSAVAVDGAGHIYVTGHFAGTMTCGVESLYSITSDCFLASFAAADGAPLWCKSLGGTGVEQCNAVTTDGSGNVYLAGAFTSTVDFGGGPRVSAGGSDCFLAAFGSADGASRWSRSFGGPADDVCAGIANDGSGNVYLAGGFGGAVTVDPASGPLTSAGGTDVLLASFTSAGVPRWSRRFGGAGDDAGRAVALDGNGNVYLTGEFRDTADFGGGPLTSAGETDVFVASFTSAGSPRWSRRFGGVKSDRGRSLALDYSAGVYLAGEFAGTVDFGTGPLTSTGTQDFFLLRLTQ